MKKILVIGYCYPPTASPEAFVTAKLLRNIPDVEIDVLTLEDGLVSESIDPVMGAYAQAISGQVVKVPAGCFLRKFARIRRLPLRPDRWVLLNRKVLKKAQQLIAEGSYECLVTRSQYHSSHLVGLELKKKFPNLPWIACFSDPWSDADHQVHVPFFSAWSAQQEKKVLSAADRLVLPTEGLKNFMLRDNPPLREKAVVIPHAFDPALYGEAKPKTEPQSDAFTIRLFGSFYHSRQPDTFVAGVKRVNVSEGLTLKVEVYGGYHPRWETVEQETGGRLCWKGGVPHTEALALMQKTDLLVVVDANGAENSIYLPSKLVDYIGCETPILAICGSGTVADITNAYGGFVVSDDPNAIARGIEAAISSLDIPVNSDVSQRFHAQKIGCQFADLLNDVENVNVY